MGRHTHTHTHMGNTPHLSLSRKEEMGSRSPVPLSFSLRKTGRWEARGISCSLQQRRWAHAPPFLSLSPAEEKVGGGAHYISLCRREEMVSRPPISPFPSFSEENGRGGGTRYLLLSRKEEMGSRSSISLSRSLFLPLFVSFSF